MADVVESYCFAVVLLMVTPRLAGLMMPMFWFVTEEAML